MSKPMKLLLLQTASNEILGDSVSRRHLFTSGDEMFSPFAFVKLCTEVDNVSWPDLPSSLRSKLLLSLCQERRESSSSLVPSVTNISSSGLGGGRRWDPSPYLQIEGASYTQFRSFLRRLEALGANWHSLAASHPSLPFERFLAAELSRFLYTTDIHTVNPNSASNTRRRVEDLEPKYDFRVASEVLGWLVRMQCRHTDLLQLDRLAAQDTANTMLSDVLIHTSCDAILSIPMFATLTAQSSGKSLRTDVSSTLIVDDRALRKFSDLLDGLLAIDIQWSSLGQTGQRGLLRLVHLAVLLVLHDIDSEAMGTSDDGTATTTTTSLGTKLFNRALHLLLSLRVQWSDLPTRPRNMLSSALAEIMLAHQARVIALLAMQNRQAAGARSVNSCRINNISNTTNTAMEVTATISAEEDKLQTTVNSLGDMVHIVQMTLRHLRVSNQTATKELRQFL
jgi:hypothetical protein